MVGATSAYALVMSGVGRDIVLVDLNRPRAEAAGLTVDEEPTVLATHLMETAREHAADLLSRQDVRALLDGLKEGFDVV